MPGARSSPTVHHITRIATHEYLAVPQVHTASGSADQPEAVWWTQGESKHVITVSPRRVVRSGSAQAAAAGLLAVALLSGCSSDDDTPDSQGPESSASSSPSEEEEQTTPPADPNEEAVLAAYQGYWDEYARAVSEEALDDYVQAINEDTVGQTPLADVTALQTQNDVLEHVLNLDEGGRYMSGEPERLAPEVAALDLDADIPTAQVTDCLDVSGWLLHDRETGEQIEFPEERLVRYPLTADLENWEGTWRVTNAVPDEESAC